MKRKKKFSPTPHPRPIPSSEATKLVSVIIPSYQRFDLLGKCLGAIPAAFAGLSYEVILVDASPADAWNAFWGPRPIDPTVRLFRLSQNRGFPFACNKGAQNARGALLFFLNNDVILPPNAGAGLVCEMDDPAVGVAGMKLVFPEEGALTEANLKHSAVQRMPGKIQHTGLFMNIRGQVFHMYLGWDPSNPRVRALHEVPFVTGAALMTRRTLFRELEGFDLAYGMGTFEDVDYCLKVTQKGLRCVVAPDIYGTHYAGATAEGCNIAYPLSQNQVIFQQKWYNKLTWNEWMAD